MKYMLMMHAPRGTGDYQVDDWSPGRLQGPHRVHAPLQPGARPRPASGWTRRGWPRRARRSWCARARTARRSTDGPFPEAKEFLAGYWIVDVDSPERAYEIAARASAAPGPGGAPLNMPIEVRQVMSAPARGRVTRGAAERRRRAPAARPRAAGARRGRAAARRLRRGGGRGAGGADRGGAAVAGERDPRQPARLAVPRRAAAHHRPPAQRDGPPAPRGRGGERGVGRVGVRAAAGRRRSASTATTRSCCSSCAATPR